MMTLKKIILFILLLLMGSNICLAEDKYEIRYRWYKEEIEGEYLLEDTSNKYQYKDNNKYIYSDYISDFKLLDSDIDLNDNTREYELKTIYNYKKPLKINYVNLGSFSDSIYIEKVNIYYKDTLLKYITTNYFFVDWNGVSGNFDAYGYLSLGLGNKYNYEDISVEIITKPTDKVINYEIRYAIGFNDNSDENVIKYMASNQESKYVPNNNWDILRCEDKVYEGSDAELKGKLYVIENAKTYYRYRNKLIYYYNVNRKYYDDNYYTNIDGYLPDYSDYKIYNTSDEVANNEVKVIENNTTNITNNRKTFSRDTSSISNTSMVNNLVKDSNTNKYLIVASIIISLTIIGIGLISISCKNCRTN